ncbi:MAG: glycosyl hydrolase 108 family protein [Acutalibacteraceae bacterium]|nr:glycosyl hydrolase 108 family protein [Acutalibacteraceae bacterium]
MTELVWGKAWELVFKNEGGYQCLREDRGNWTSGQVGVGICKGTKYGICAMSYPNIDIKNLTEQQAKEIYHRDYWLKYKCDRLPDALSVAVFDYAVNSGGQCIKDLQACLGVKVDGIIGNQTIGSANSKPTRQLLQEYILRRLNYLVTKCKWNTFGKTWGVRINDVYNFCEKLL